jgi:Cu(I)/Ag(I) efflux system membrane fusion protein
VDARALLAAARQRLHVLGLSDAEIADAHAGAAGIELRAPLDGVVAQLAVQQGQQLVAGAPLMVLNSLDTVWVEADVPQAQMPGIAVGIPVVVTVSALPGATFDAQVQVVLPQVDPATRTQRVRIELPNPEHRLAPGMFAQVSISVAGGAAHPLVPDEALIATGDDTRVVLAEGDGRFRIARVHAGLSAGGETEILSGLSGNERVITSGQFLIDSEASLSGALQRLQTEAESAPHPDHPAQHRHPDGAHAEPRQ